MTKTTAAGPLLPNPQGPKTIGLLNIIFGASVMVCSLCQGFSAALTPSFTAAMRIPQEQMVEQADQRREALLKDLRDQEEAATAEEDKAIIRARRQQVESQPKPTLPPGMDMMKMGFGRKEVIATMWVDVLTSLVLNTLMIVAGVGLIRFREWGRRLSLWVAGAKVLRLVVVYGIYVLVVVPIFSKGMGDVLADALAQQQAMMGRGPAPGAPNLQDLVRMYGIFYSVMYLGIAAFGLIYPAISLWVLSRPGARAACRAEGASPAPEADWT